MKKINTSIATILYIYLSLLLHTSCAHHTDSEPILSTSVDYLLDDKTTASYQLAVYSDMRYSIWVTQTFPDGEPSGRGPTWDGVYNDIQWAEIHDRLSNLTEDDRPLEYNFSCSRYRIRGSFLPRTPSNWNFSDCDNVTNLDEWIDTMFAETIRNGEPRDEDSAQKAKEARWYIPE